MSDGGSGKLGCGRSLGCSCLGCLAVVVIGGLAIWASWDVLAQSGLGRSVTATVETVKGQVAAANRLRESLIADYPADDLRVDVDVRSTNGVTTKTLRVSILNPRFDLPESAEARLATAREIAAAVKARFPDLVRYDVLRVELRSETGGGVASSSSSRFDFPTAEL